MIILMATENSFFIDLLEKGGLPALALGICFTIFMFWIKTQSKKDDRLQQEREKSSEREAAEYVELMKAYKELITQFIELTKESTQTVTRLAERVGQCPLKSSSAPGEVIHAE